MFNSLTCFLMKMREVERATRDCVLIIAKNYVLVVIYNALMSVCSLVSTTRIVVRNSRLSARERLS
jgi:hypothetical protein